MATAADKRGVGGVALDHTELTSGNLGLFNPIQADGYTLDNKDMTIRPLTSVTSDGPFEFIIPSTDADYLVLPSIVMEGALSVSKLSDTTGAYEPVATTDDFSVVNLAPYSLFKMMEVSLNNVSIEDVSTPVWPYKCFFETLLAHDKAATRTHLKARGYYPDSVGSATNTTAGSDETTGYSRRRELVKDNKKMYFECPLHASFFATGSRYLPPGVNVKIKLSRSPDAFTILANVTKKNAYKLTIHDLVLRVKKIKVANAVLEAHARSFLKQNAILPFQKSYTRPFVIPSGITSYIVQNVVVGELPHTLLFGMVNATAMDGSPRLNPFVFNHNKLDGLYITVNGVMKPIEPYEFDFANKNYYRGYMDLLRTCGAGYGNATINVTPEEYASFLTLFAYDLSPDGCSGFHQHIPGRSGHINIHLKFSTALTSPLKLLVYYVKHAAVSIDAERNVSLVDGLASEPVEQQQQE